MGGFVLCDKNGQPTKILTFPHFKRLLYDGVIDFPCLTSSEIQERSNFHPAFALIAFLQAAWFATRCLSRLINASSMYPDMPVITHLEAVAAAIVIVNWCTFFFAWQKPLDARFHILIKPNANPSTHHDRYRSRGLDTTAIKPFEREENLSGSQGTERRIQLEFPQSQSTSIIASFRITPHALISTLFWPIKSIYTDISELIPREGGGPSKFPDGTLKIPLFYVQNTTHYRMLFLLPATVVGMGVSSVSLFFLLRPGSNLYLSSQAGHLAFRIISITSTSLSAFMLGLIIIANVFNFFTFPFTPCLHEGCLMGLSNVFQFILMCTLLIGLAPFLLARVVLLVASVIDFRSTLGEVFWDRSWADYIPHFS